MTAPTAPDAATDLLGQATDLLVAAQADPGRVAAAAGRVIAAAAEAGDVTSHCVALRALGTSQRLLGAVDDAIVTLATAVEVAERAGDGRQAALARMPLAAALAMAGRTAEAFATLDRAEPALAGGEAAQAAAQRGSVLAFVGRNSEALAAYGHALPGLRAAGDDVYCGHVLANRGVIHMLRADLRRARADMTAARRHYERAGQDSAAASMTNNLGVVAVRAGDLPLALELFEAAAHADELLGRSTDLLLPDRAQALLAAGLSDEAAATCRRSAAALEGAGDSAEAALAWLSAAEADLVGERFEEADGAARRAAVMLQDQDRPGFAAVAEGVALAARTGAGHWHEDDLELASSLARRLEDEGYVLGAASARLTAVRLAIAAGLLDRASAELGRAEPLLRSAPTPTLVTAWWCRALLRRARGDDRGADAAARAALRLLDRSRASLGALDLRTGLATHALAVARLGMELALESGSARRVLQWVDWTRSRALVFAPARPPQDPALAAELDRLRVVTAQLRDAERDGALTGDLLREQRRLQERLARRSRTGRGDATSSRDGAATAAGVPAPGRGPLPRLRGELDRWVVVAPVPHGGRLHTVVVRRGRHRLVDGAALDGVTATLDTTLRHLRRVLAGGHPRVVAAAAEAVRHAAAELDDLLLGPLRLAGDEPVVVVPPAVLREVPWGLLPSLADRTHTVVPTPRLFRPWRPGPPGRLVAVAGPDLTHADSEAAEVAADGDDVTVLAGASATPEAVLAAMDGADVVHLACHGTFEEQNPLFSAVHLHGGALLVHDLLRLRRLPRLVVLAACEVGRSAERPGDELLGLPGALLAMGVQSVIAAHGLLPDTADTVVTAVGLHARLRAGASPPEALHLARSDPGAPGTGAAGGAGTPPGAGALLTAHGAG